MIREALHQDVPEIKKMVLKLISDLKWHEQSGAPIDEPTIETMIRFYIRYERGFVWVHETDGRIDGFFIGAVEPFLLDIRHFGAHELVSDGVGLDSIWNEFFQWAKKKNAVTAILGCYSEHNGSRFRRIK